MTNREIKNIYLEAQEIKLNIDKLYDEVINQKTSYNNNEIDIIIEQIHNYHKLFWSKFSELSMIQNDDYEQKLKRMSYSVEGGLAYIVYYLEGTDISTINLEYKKGICF